MRTLFFSDLYNKSHIKHHHMDAYASIPSIHTKPNEEIFAAIALPCLLIRIVYTLPCTAMFSALKDAIYCELIS